MADGSLIVNEFALDESDPIDQLAVAREGDLGAAWLLVIDGSLARWVDEGHATTAPGSDVSDDLAADMDLVIRWMVSTYGFFAEGPWDCPG